MANGDINLATLWVPVAPETSQVGPAMEKAGKEAKGKFGDAVKGIGSTISDDLAKVGSKAKDTFTGLGKSLHDTLAKSSSDISTTLGRALGGSGDKFAEPLKKLTGASDESLASVQHLAGAISGLKGGDVGGAVDGIAKSLLGVQDEAKKAGVDISGLITPLQDASTKSAEMKTKAEEFAGIFKDMPGIVGKVGKAISELAGPIAAGIALGKQLADSLDKIPEFHNRFFNSDGSYRNSFDEWSSHQPGLSWLNPPQFKEPEPYPQNYAPVPSGAPGIQSPLPPPMVGNNPPLPTLGPLVPPGMVGKPGSLDPFAALFPAGMAPPPESPASLAPLDMPDGQSPPPPRPPVVPKPAPEPAPATTTPSARSGGGGGSVTDRQSLYAAGSRVSNLYAFAQSLVGTPYSTQLRNDCSGMVAELSSVALGLPVPSAGERFSTDNEGAWLSSHGFQEGMGPAGSFRVGWHNGGPGGGHTAATLPDGTHAEQGGSHGSFTLGAGAAGAEDSQFEHHAYLPADKIAGLGASGGRSPIGTEHDPLYVSQTGGSEGGLESQGQQLGQGLVSGVLEMFGLDGSVLKGFGSGKSPLDFGIVKLFGGVANSFLHMGQSAGGVGGGDGAMLPGMGSMIPGLGALLGPGAAISAGAVPANGAGKTADASGGSTTIIQGDYAPYNVHGVGTVQEQQQQYLSSNRTQGMITANAGGLPG